MQAGMNVATIAGHDDGDGTVTGVLASWNDGAARRAVVAFAEMAQDDPRLRGRQPWKAAYQRDSPSSDMPASAETSPE